MITGKHLIEWGYQPRKWFGEAIVAANAAQAAGRSYAGIKAVIDEIQLAREPVEIPLRTNTIPFHVFLDAENQAEQENKDAVIRHLDVLMRLPNVRDGAIMPDACPSGSAPGTIPVGGVVASTDIHPGMHSSDVCCSMAISVFKRHDDPKKLLDAVMAVTHFGPGGRSTPVEFPKGSKLGYELISNPFLNDEKTLLAARHQFATQGDGNHFAFVGRMKSSGDLALVTHHGSRGVGAFLYKKGLLAAQRHTAIIAPRVPKHNAWIDADSRAGDDYWSALQIVRRWTRESHYALHDLAAQMIGNRVKHRFWNEHNFVFQRSDGLFHHAKGATPSFTGFSDDDIGVTLIPMNCSQPILIAKHNNAAGVKGFAPHGAGRNYSRTQHLNMHDENDAQTAPHAALSLELAELQERGLDIRSFCGVPDLSELPSAYKNAAAVKAQIEKYALAEIVDEVLPYGSVMAGDWQKDAPWRKKGEPK